MAFANPYYQNQYQMPQYQARDWPMLKGRPGDVFIRGVGMQYT